MSIYDAPSDDLTVFLLAQLAEDQRTARDLPDASDGDRRLLDIDSKLHIIAEHVRGDSTGWEVEEFPDGFCYRCQTVDGSAVGEWPCTTMRALVLPYAEREGYQAGWAIPAPGAPQEITQTWGTNLAVLADDVDATVPMTGKELIAHQEGDLEGTRGPRLRIRRSGTTVWLDALQATPPASADFPAFDVQTLDPTRRVVISSQPAQGHRDPFRDTRPDLCDHYAVAGRCPVRECAHA